MGKTFVEDERPCDSCVNVTRYGCVSWNCEYINRDEAIKAWREKHEMADRKTEPMTTNLEWLKTLSAEELADWFYDEWLHHLQYRWSSSRGGLIIWLKDRKTENSSEIPNNSTISKMEQVEDEPQTERSEWLQTP